MKRLLCVAGLVSVGVVAVRLAVVDPWALLIAAVWFVGLVWLAATGEAPE